MKLDWDRKEEKRSGERLRRRSSEELSRTKSSEELLRMKSSEDRERRPALSGFKPLKKDEPSLLETMRMENSRGILALGGDERKRPALVVTEKSRPREGAVSERERVLLEKGKREYPLGQNRIMENPGSREEGAVGLLLRPAMTRGQIMAQMKRCMDERGQKTLGRMMPFMVTEKELSGKKKLEEALEEARRRAQRENPTGQQASAVKLLERCVEEKKEELVRKRQTEAYFAERLEKGVREEKKTVWKAGPDWDAGRQRRGAADVEDEDAGEAGGAVAVDETDAKVENAF